MAKDAGLSSQRPGFKSRPEHVKAETSSAVYGLSIGDHMDIDKFNIYKNKSYWVVTAIALLMLIGAIFSIPHIKKGVEFTGGILAVADLNHSINASLLQVDLEKAGYTGSKVLEYKTAYGYRIEAESPLPEELQKAEQLRDEVKNYLSKYAKTVERRQEDPTLLAKANSTLTELCSLANISNNATTPLEVEKEAEDAVNVLRKTHEARLSSILEKHIGKVFSLETVTPTLSQSFSQKVKLAGIASAILAIIFVFFIFREVAPSLAVLIGAASDMTIAAGFMGWAGIPLTLASFAALLMLIGYSLDTDVLLTMRVLKHREGDARDRAWSALKTGTTMTLTGLLSFTVLFLVSLALRISTYYQIGAVALAGLVGDLFATWGINAVLLLHTVKRIKK